MSDLSIGPDLADSERTHGGSVILPRPVDHVGRRGEEWLIFTTLLPPLPSAPDRCWRYFPPRADEPEVIEGSVPLSHQPVGRRKRLLTPSGRTPTDEIRSENVVRSCIDYGSVNEIHSTRTALAHVDEKRMKGRVPAVQRHSDRRQAHLVKDVLAETRQFLQAPPFDELAPEVPHPVSRQEAVWAHETHAHIRECQRALEKGGVKVGPVVWVRALDESLEISVRLRIGRVHQDDVVPPSAEVDEGQAPCGILGEQPAPYGATVLGALRVVFERRQDAVFRLVPELLVRDLIHIEKPLLLRLPLHQLGEEHRLLWLWSPDPLPLRLGNGGA